MTRNLFSHSTHHGRHAALRPQRLDNGHLRRTVLTKTDAFQKVWRLPCLDTEYVPLRTADSCRLDEITRHKVVHLGSCCKAIHGCSITSSPFVSVAILKSSTAQPQHPVLSRCFSGRETSGLHVVLAAATSRAVWAVTTTSITTS